MNKEKVESCNEVCVVCGYHIIPVYVLGGNFLGSKCDNCLKFERYFESTDDEHGK